MGEQPTVWGRMRALVRDEISAAAPEAYRRASLLVFELLDRAQARREACVLEGLTPWTFPPAVRAELLCAWNAFVLQTLGSELLDADYAAHPPTAGYVPHATAQQALAYFGQVEGWLDRAQQAHASPDYVLDVPVPAELPPWGRQRHPRTHLQGLLQALHAVGEHAAAFMAALPERVPAPAQQKQLRALHQLFASARSKARYAAELHGIDPPPAVHDRVEPYAVEAMELFFRLGQFAADPALAGGAGEPPAPAAELPAAVQPPGEPLRKAYGRKFDPWHLTDPDVRLARAAETGSPPLLQRLWDRDPDREHTLRIQDEILDAFDRGAVAYATDELGRIGHFYRCPWGAVYVAREAVTLDSQPIAAGQHFVLDVSAEGSARNPRFMRRVLTGRFERLGPPSPDTPWGARYVSPRWDS